MDPGSESATDVTSHIPENSLFQPWPVPIQVPSAVWGYGGMVWYGMVWYGIAWYGMEVSLLQPGLATRSSTMSSGI